MPPKNSVSGIVVDGTGYRRARLSTSTPSVDRFCTKYISICISQIHWPLKPVTGKAPFNYLSRLFDTVWGERFLAIYLILPAALGSGVYSVSNINGYKMRSVYVLGSKEAADAQAWQLYRHPRADYLDNLASSTFENSIGLRGLLLR
jgi:hypothetical protein